MSVPASHASWHQMLRRSLPLFSRGEGAILTGKGLERGLWAVAAIRAAGEHPLPRVEREVGEEHVRLLKGHTLVQRRSAEGLHRQRQHLREPKAKSSSSKHAVPFPEKTRTRRNKTVMGPGSPGSTTHEGTPCLEPPGFGIRIVRPARLRSGTHPLRKRHDEGRGRERAAQVHLRVKGRPVTKRQRTYALVCGSRHRRAASTRPRIARRGQGAFRALTKSTTELLPTEPPCGANAGASEP